MSGSLTQDSNLTTRETEVIRILRVLRSHSDKLVVIGGYAVSALGSHRFSVDCDMVISERQLKPFEKILAEEGYSNAKASGVIKGVHGAKTTRYVKLVGGGRVSVDLYANSVVCRDTGGEWSYQLILRNSLETNVVGIIDSVVARVPKRELLIAMKLHAARDTDLRDVVMLSEAADWNAIAHFATTGSKSKSIEQLGSAMRRIGSKEFSPALKAEFGLRTDVSRLIRETLEHLETITKLLK